MVVAVAPDIMANTGSAGTAILTCRPNSHLFTERKLILENTANKNAAVKIGRSIARNKVAPTNGIFDCKVLSRNHAIIWYYNGKFYLQDTKSSNGTFVNNQRLSKTNEESAPHELCSGDVVQFGVDVIETNRNLPVTHGCIIANLKLFLPDGKEAKASPTSMLISSMPLEELYQLNTCIQEALQRENLLKSKLSKLQYIITDLKKAADVSWTALIQEDRLLSRVEFLESQLAAYSKSFTDDKLRDEIKLLHKDKSAYENQLKEVMKKMLAEKVEVMQKSHDTERKLTNAENECSNLQELIDKNRDELQEIIKKYQDQVNKNKSLESTINELMNSNQEKSNSLEKLQFETLQAQKQLDAFTLKDSLMHDKLKNYYMNFHSIKEKMNLVKNALGQDSKVEQIMIAKYLDEVYQIMNQFDEYFMRFTDPESSGLSSITDIEKVTNDLREQLHTAEDEHNSLQQIINRNEEQLTFLEQSKYLHLDKIAGLELQLEKLKQNYNSDCFENEKLEKSFGCDTLLISDDKNINSNQKDLIIDVNNKFNSEKDFVIINKEIEDSSKKIDDISYEITKCRSELVDAKNCLLKNEKWIINLQNQFTLLEKSRETLISLKLNASESKNSASLQGELNEAFEQIKKYKEDHCKMAMEIESLREKLKHSEDVETELKEEYEKLKSVIKKYESNVNQKSSENSAEVLGENSSSPVESEERKFAMHNVLLELSSPVSDEEILSSDDAESVCTLIDDSLDEEDSPVATPESDHVPTLNNDDDTSDSSSEMTDSSTLIRVRKPKPTIVPSCDTLRQSVTTESQTSDEISLCNIKSHKLVEESFVFKVSHYFTNVDDVLLITLGIIAMLIIVLTPILSSLENILSHLTAAYDPK